MLIIVLTRVHVRSCSERVSLVGVKLSLLRMSALWFQDVEAHTVFQSALL